MPLQPTFKDGKRTIDYVLVYKTSALLTEGAATKHKTFIDTLKKLGLELENEAFSVDEDIIFVKIHAPDSFTFSYATLLDIELSCNSFDYRPHISPPPNFMSTPLTKPNINDPIYARAPETISGEIPKKITTSERIMVINQLLSRCIWGEEKWEYGLNRLIAAKIIKDAFPLHDGTYKWTREGPLNDRQLLARYWGKPNCCLKAQPLNLVEKYFGTEYALYFAWLGMYIKFLVPAAILSILVIIYGLATIFTPMNRKATQICNSDMIMCPKCHYNNCPREYLSNSCYSANMAYLFDNGCAVMFAAIMSLWATIFMEFWQREESVLQLQWNVKSLKYTITMRPEFLEAAPYKRFSPITNRLEPFIPKRQRTIRYVITLASVTLLLCIMILVTFGVMIYRVTVNTILIQSPTPEIMPEVMRNKYRGLFASVSGALISAVFIFIFKWAYERIALFLTDMEVHRTVREYNDSYVFKSYALAFANNYSATFYVAFFKGKFYTHPGDLELFDHLGGINSDICDPSGCIVDLAILLIIIMVVKAFVSNVVQVFLPKITKRFNHTISKVKNQSNIPQWEDEYLLAKADQFFIVDEYMDMVIQYGFVNFFIMGFPLAPLFALLNNLAEIRVDASKVTKSYRRPVPNRQTGLGAWFAILQATTYIGVVTNALVIAFTSNFMERTIYSYLKGTPGLLGADLDETFSVFELEEFAILRSSKASNSTLCYYPGQRYPPDHPLKYQRRKDFWQHLGIKFAVVVIFEHLVIIIKGLVAYAIPDVPFSVKQQIAHQEKMTTRAKNKTISNKYMKGRPDSLRRYSN
ncbi:unnamed protein product [Ceutorhynchus assimilis]|uniref:Anoctamin n=1 Tax=Ceutorhynchus assimilis TaxID=467358 RepID=A0A9N9QIL5_9CUCU|nr:unnamed protein product [Ceutorhynchus assimilis]